MKFYNLLIKYRFYLSILGLILAITVNVFSGFWPSFILYFISIIGFFSHFFIGPLRLVQEPMMSGDVAEVEKILNSVWFPNLLFKPIRSTYYTLKGNLAMMNKDFKNAEQHLKRSSEIGTAVPEAEGSNKLQLGMMAMQKSDFKSAEGYIRAAIRAGFGDKESEAVAYFYMCQIFLNKREYRAAKEYYRKAKNLKPTTPDLVKQIKQMDSYISRIPG